MKTIVCGPPHSGKSVFLGGLRALLPEAYLFRACPDGEGTWTWRTPEAASYRRKARFSVELVDWYCRSIRHAQELSGIVLVDVGGKTSAENERIFAECDSAIILAGDQHSIPEWREFCRKCGVRVLAEVHSDYSADADKTDGQVMAVHHLERGEDVSSRPVIQKLAAMLDAAYRKQTMTNNTTNDTIEVSDLANMLGKKAEQKTLPNGRTVSSVQWTGEDLRSLAVALHNTERPRDGVVKINGAGPAWLIASIAHECHPAVAHINSPDGYVPASCREPDETPAGKNLDWTVEDKGEYVLVKVQQTDPSVPLDPADLPGWTPPAVPFENPVVISGRMPNWGMAAISMAYHGHAAACALFQPGVGATVAWTHTSRIPLGSKIDVA